MDAATVRSRLIAEGIACRCRRDGVLIASLMKPRAESWSLWLRDRVRQFPGVKVVVTVERPASDPFFAHAEIRFRLGPEPATVMVESGR